MTVKKTILTLTLLVALAALIASHVLLLDGLGGTLGAIMGEDTVYTAAYTSAAFRRVSVGDTARQVLVILGEPEERFGMLQDPSAPDGWWYRRAGSDAEGWSYSHSQHSDNYRIRVIIFRDGKVVDKVAKLYID